MVSRSRAVDRPRPIDIATGVRNPIRSGLPSAKNEEREKNDPSNSVSVSSSPPQQSVTLIELPLFQPVRHVRKFFLPADELCTPGALAEQRRAHEHARVHERGVALCGKVSSIDLATGVRTFSACHRNIANELSRVTL